MTLYKRLLGSQIYFLNNNGQWNQQMLSVWCEEKVEHKNQVTYIISNIQRYKLKISISTDSNEKNNDLGMVAHAFNPRAGEAEAGRSLWV